MPDSKLDSMSDFSPLLKLEHVSMAFRPTVGRVSGGKEIHALTDVSLEVWQGETVAIIGGSGSGKTTLTRILLGFMQPTGGYVSYRGMPLGGDVSSEERGAMKSTLAALRKVSGVVFQNPVSSFDPRWTIGKSIAEPLEIQGFSKSRDAIVARVGEALTSVSLNPDEFAHRYPRSLSGGQVQRAAIARAIVNYPQILLADEPTSAIDMPTRLDILQTLAQVKERAANAGHPMSTVIVSHDLGVVQHIADRIIVLHSGRIVDSGSAVDILSHPQSDYTKSLLAAAML
jgi:peptide/nickel transport system ATP-binding protein